MNIQKRIGRPSLFYDAKEVAEIFHISPKTVYKKPDEFGGEWIAGCLRFAKNRIDQMARAKGAETT